MNIRKITITAAAMMISAGGVSAATFPATYSGNPCTPGSATTEGVGANCELVLGEFRTPAIAKFEGFGNFDGDVTFSFTSYFDSVTIDDFEFDFTSPSTGTLTYLKDDDDPGITFLTAKGGPRYTVFDVRDEGLTFSFQTPVNPGGNLPALSNLIVFDRFGDDNGPVPTPPPGVIPLPATAWLLLGGLGGLSFLRRRKGAA